jgi:hypothetical protein
MRAAATATAAWAAWGCRAHPRGPRNAIRSASGPPGALYFWAPAYRMMSLVRGISNDRDGRLHLELVRFANDSLAPDIIHSALQRELGIRLSQSEFDSILLGLQRKLLVRVDERGRRPNIRELSRRCRIQ